MRLGRDQIHRIALGVTAFVMGLVVLVVTLALVAEQVTPARGGSPGGTVAPAAAPSSTADASQPATETPVSPHGASVAAYQGLASWVDVYDASAWRDPGRTVGDMAKHGVRTLFVQTSHYNSHKAFYNEKSLRTFITEGHAHGMRVVAWYLPNMKPGSVDYKRIAAAFEFRTADGQSFDSIGLDIECSDIHSDAMRNRGLEALSRKVRALVGPTYPLGAIIPAPVGLRKDTSVWPDFPYTMLAGIYDVFMPMGYYTYHGHATSTAYNDVRANLSILRSKPGCAQMPIHMIGGIAEDSSAAQVAAFVKGAREGKCLGASLYGWGGTSDAMWRSLSAIKP